MSISPTSNSSQDTAPQSQPPSMEKETRRFKKNLKTSEMIRKLILNLPNEQPPHALRNRARQEKASPTSSLAKSASLEKQLSHLNIFEDK